MSGIGPSIGRDPYREQQNNDPSYTHEEEAKRAETAAKLLSFTTAISCIKKCVDSLIHSIHSLTISMNLEAIIRDLHEFKKRLIELTQEDTSHNPDFTKNLSLSWQTLYQHFIDRDLSSMRQDPALHAITTLIQEIQTFPPGEEFTLGYYLIEHAGQSWIPFPFMDILQKLHEDYHKDPATSLLHHWIKTINRITDA